MLWNPWHPVNTFQDVFIFIELSIGLAISLFRFFCTILQKNLNKIFGQPRILAYRWKESYNEILSVTWTLDKNISLSTSKPKELRALSFLFISLIKLWDLLNHGFTQLLTFRTLQAHQCQDQRTVKILCLQERSSVLPMLLLVKCLTSAFSSRL